MSYDYFEGLDGESKSRYLQKLAVLNVKECPYKLPAGTWENNPTKWPQLEWGDLYAYLIDSPGIFTREKMKNHKSLEATNFFKSGWVQTVFSYRPTNSSHIILRADVKPSQRVTDDPHHPWVALTQEGYVTNAHCDCMAGLGESCSHIAALLFKIEAAVRLGYTKTACTDEPCKWNVDFVKDVKPATISKINFYKDTSVGRIRKRTNAKRKKQFTPSTPEEQQQLLTALSKCASKPVVLSCFNNFSTPFHWKVTSNSDPKIPVSLRQYYSSENAELNEKDLLEKCGNFVSRMTVSDDQINYVYDVTKSQSNSMTWHEQRTGRITSSVVHDVLHTSCENPSKSVLKKICNPQPNELKVPAILWGKRHESDGLRVYKQVMLSSDPPHENFTVKECGLLLSKDYPFLGASADSISSCQCHGNHVVEVKCPYSHKDSELKDFLASETCCLNNGKLKENHSYYSQVQLQMLVHDAKQCDLVIWTPKFCMITYVQRDDSFIMNMLNKTQVFFMKCIVPELLTRKIEHKEASAVIHVNNAPVKLFCICQTPDDGRETMIGCDNPTCQFQWYHLSCVKLKRAPKGNWLCRKCRKQTAKCK